MQSKPIDEAKAKELVKRLRVLPFAGDAEDAIGRRETVGRTLMSAAESGAHAEVIVESLIRTLKAFPVPMDVWAAAEATPPPANVLPPADHCQACAGTGWRRVVKSGMEAVEECGCRRGEVVTTGRPARATQTPDIEAELQATFARIRARRLKPERPRDAEETNEAPRRAGAI